MLSVEYLDNFEVVVILDGWQSVDDLKLGKKDAGYELFLTQSGPASLVGIMV